MKIEEIFPCSGIKFDFLFGFNDAKLCRLGNSVQAASLRVFQLECSSPRAALQWHRSRHSSRRWAERSTDIRIECSAVYTLQCLCMARPSHAGQGHAGQGLTRGPKSESSVVLVRIRLPGTIHWFSGIFPAICRQTRTLHSKQWP